MAEKCLACQLVQWSVLLAAAILVAPAMAFPVAFLDSGLAAADAPSASEAAREASDVGAASLPSFDLMIVVPSLADDAELRSAVRETWAQYLNSSAINCTQCANHSTKILFVLGSEGNKSNIDQETKEFSDIGILDDFKHPSTGAEAEMTQRAIRFAVEHFKFKLLVKVDEQAWVFMDRLVDFLDDNRLFELNVSSPGVYGGNFRSFRQPALLDGSALDEVFYSLTGASVYPKHAEGAGFLLTPDLCEFISGMGAPSEDTSGAPKWGDEYGWAPVPRLASLASEEVSVGFWLVPVNHTKLHMPVALTQEACPGNPSEPILIDHGMDIASLKKRWQTLVTTGEPCIVPPVSFLKKGRRPMPHRQQQLTMTVAKIA